MTRRPRGAPAATTAAVLLALTGCSPAGDTIVSGRFSPEKPVALHNLTVADGRYLVSFAMTVFVASPEGSVQLTCDVVDTTGRVAQLPGLVRTVTSGQWQHIGAEDVFELPDLTMGIRCYPDREASLQLIVRRAVLSAEPVLSAALGLEVAQVAE